MTAVMVKIGHCPGDTQEAGEGPLESSLTWMFTGTRDVLVQRERR